VTALVLLAAVAIAVARSPVTSRRTAPPPAADAASSGAFTGLPRASGPLVLWAVGDGAAGRPPAAALARRIARDRPARVLYLGDVYEHGTPAEFRSYMRGAYGALLRRMLPTPGNHEWPNHVVGYDRFWREITGRPTPPWYTVRLGTWQLLSLNSEAPHGASSAQVVWLRRHVRRPGTCRLAFWHRPRFSAGLHGDQPDVAPLWDTLAGHATLVLNGHDHDLQRLRPADGMTEVVSGAGGKDHYGVDERDRRLAFSDEHRDGAVRIVLRRRRADLQTIALDGAVLDRSSVSCRR
jgi:hypothetical protein